MLNEKRLTERAGLAAIQDRLAQPGRDRARWRRRSCAVAGRRAPAFLCVLPLVVHTVAPWSLAVMGLITPIVTTGSAKSDRRWPTAGARAWRKIVGARS